MYILSPQQIKEADAYTVREEPVSSLDLMERAARQCTEWFCARHPASVQVVLFCGPGNNGGDGLAMARQLKEKGYSPLVCLLTHSSKLSPDRQANLLRWTQIGGSICPCDHLETLTISNKHIIIDALFGTGLSRPLEGMAAKTVEWINQHSREVISIDLPSGLLCEIEGSPPSPHIVRATYTLTFERPKLPFFFAENELYTGKWEILPIGLHPTIMEKLRGPYQMLTHQSVRPLLHIRPRFSHKGLFGHALLFAGSTGKAGAAVLACKAYMRAGGGLLTLSAPGDVCMVQQCSVPEVMCLSDSHAQRITTVPDMEMYRAIGAGPGMGTHPETALALKVLIDRWKGPMVLDADALNILSEHPQWLSILPEQTILTPHPREFDRLAGPSLNGFERHLKQRALSIKYRLIIVLKGAFSGISFPDGQYCFNSTGNPGMATAGSGDVLTGILLSLLAQKYPAKEASQLGVYLHGLAGDIAAESMGREALIAGDIVEYFGKTFLTFNTNLISR